MFMGSPALSCHASDCATWAHGLSVAIAVVCAINQLHQHMHVLLRATRQHTGCSAYHSAISDSSCRPQMMCVLFRSSVCRA